MEDKACISPANALPHTIVYCLTRRQAGGLLIDSMCGLLSLISTSVVLIFIARNAYRAVCASGNRRLLKMPIELYLISLFMADFMHALGATLKLKWVMDGKVQSGAYCSVQGFSSNVGSTAIAMTTLVIAVHTFITIWRGVTTRSFFYPSLIVGAIWVYTILLPAISMMVFNDPSNPFYQPTPYWCWVSKRLAFRVVGQWIWMWSALLVSLLLYLLLFLWFRGNITVKPEYPWWKFKVHRRTGVYNHSRRQRYSYIMVIYAAIYSTLIMPWSIVRWRAFALENHHGVSSMSSDATFATISIYNLIGFANILLFLFTRGGLLSFQDSPAETSVVVSDLSTFSTVGKVEDDLEPE